MKKDPTASRKLGSVFPEHLNGAMTKKNIDKFISKAF